MRWTRKGSEILPREEDLRDVGGPGLGQNGGASLQAHEAHSWEGVPVLCSQERQKWPLRGSVVSGMSQVLILCCDAPVMDRQAVKGEGPPSWEDGAPSSHWRGIWEGCGGWHLGGSLAFCGPQHGGSHDSTMLEARPHPVSVGSSVGLLFMSSGLQ